MAKLRIATWNLERPKLNGFAKNSRRVEKIQEVNADLWVLTETSSAIALDGYTSLASGSEKGYHTAGENFVTVWSRWPILRSIPTFDPSYTVCAEVGSPAGPMLVFGTILTYANDPGPNRKLKSRRWEEHRKAINEHADDWFRLRKKFPKHHLCIAGDFNQSRDGSGWYEDAQSVKMLGEVLDQCSLACVTEDDMQAKGLSRATIDHICLSKSLVPQVIKVGAWEGKNADGGRMSDHNGIFVDINAQQRT